MKFLRKVGRWVVIIYVAQAFVGIGAGVYFAIILSPAEIERMVSCVAY